MIPKTVGEAMDWLRARGWTLTDVINRCRVFKNPDKPGRVVAVRGDLGDPIDQGTRYSILRQANGD
jgi:hypothetical protein